MPDRYLIPIPMAHGKTSANKGLLSIYFLPRLVTVGALSTYPDWSDWPATLAGFDFRVRINGNVRNHTVTSPTPSSAKWLAVFPGTTPVKGFQVVDRTDTQLRTFDESGFTDSLRNAYRRVATTHAQNPPTVQDLLANAQTSEFLTGTAVQSPLPGAQEYLEPTGPSAPPEEPEVDFHNALMNLGAHPHLLRLLGVVVDVEVDLPAANPNTVRVETLWPTTGPAMGLKQEIAVRMNTSSDFWMLPNPNVDFQEQNNGWTELGDGDWKATQSDALAATQQLTEMSRVLDDPTASAALPALEDGGVALLRIANAEAVLNLFERRKQVEDHIDQVAQGTRNFVELYAEDVAQGERIDIKDNVSKKFLSVFQRQTGGYVFPRNLGQNVVPGPDEGWTTFVLQSDQKETYQLVDPATGEEPFDVVQPTAVQRVRDAIFVWTGWSSVGPPPGRIIDAEGNVIEAPDNKVDPLDAVQFESTYHPLPGTLPRLRYGRTYTFRARPVDLSGVSRTVKEAHPAGAESPPAFYGRGPVPPPALVRAENKDPLPGVGEFVTTVVLLSDYNTQLSNIEPQMRMLLPPKASQFRLELSGLPNSGIKPADYGDISERDARSTETECNEDPLSGDLVIKPFSNGVARPVRYYPDPAGSGATLARLPRSQGPKVVPFVGTWPDLRGAKLVFKATGTGPKLIKDTTGNTLEVTVPKAFDGVVELSCSISASQLGKFAVHNLLTAANKKALKNLMLRGRHWMLSSRSSLHVVHAVRRPMTKPTIALLTADRPELDGLDVIYGGQVNVHSASTGRTLLSATWEDPYDSSLLPEPSTQPGAKVLGYVANGVVALDSQFSDTKRHDLEVTAEAFSKFSSYFTEEKDRTFTTNTITMDTRGVVASSVVLSDPVNGTAYLLNVDYTIDAAEGKATRTTGGAIPAGSLVKTRFIRLPTSRLSTESSPDDTFYLPVPASSPPLAPRVREVIPSFSFSQTRVGKTITKVRSGAILRVWLERPWFSSGVGELLGVLVDTGSPAVPDSTRYGRDPVVEGPGSVIPRINHFPRASTTETGVAPGLNVAAHEVVFDPERKLWYSDVEIDASIGYRPFARLSLARYQPVAIDGAHISGQVDVDPMRLGVTRAASVKLVAADELQITLLGVEHDGIPDDTNGGALLFNTVNVWFQKPFPGVTDPDLKWRSVQGPFPATRVVLSNGLTRWRVTQATTLNAPLRVLIQESEPVMRSDGAGGVEVGSEVVYVETFDLTAGFLTPPQP